MANAVSVKKLGFLVFLVFLILSGSALGGKDAKWDWALLTMITNVSNSMEIDVRSGQAEVSVNGDQVAVTFHDAKHSKNLAPRTFRGTVDRAGAISGKLRGFDYDFEYEPMIGTYRTSDIPGGCKQWEIALRDQLPRRRTMLVSKQVCSPEASEGE